MKIMKQLWNSEAGFVVSAELVLISTVLVIGMLVGLTTIRDQVLQELADVADAVSEVDQSYSFTGIAGHAVSTAGTIFSDTSDFCETLAGEQEAGNAPQCLDVEVPPELNVGGERS